MKTLSECFEVASRDGSQSLIRRTMVSIYNIKKRKARNRWKQFNAGSRWWNSRYN